MKLIINQLNNAISEAKNALKLKKSMNKKEISYWNKQIRESKKRLQIYS